MSWTKRINSRNYTFGSLINIGFALYAGYPNFIEAWWLSFVVISAVLNHYFTVKAFSTMIDNRINSRTSTRGSRLFFYFLFKTLFLAAGFICLMVFASNKVLQGLLIYIFQLIILALSIKNIGKFIKKGSST